MCVVGLYSTPRLTQRVVQDELWDALVAVVVVCISSTYA